MRKIPWHMKKRPLGKIKTFFEYTVEKVPHLSSNLFRQAPCEETFSQEYMPSRFNQQKSCKRQIVCNRTTRTYLTHNFFSPVTPPTLFILIIIRQTPTQSPNRSLTIRKSYSPKNQSRQAKRPLWALIMPNLTRNAWSLGTLATSDDQANPF